ncbi:protein of unknown function [Taphrina deformans PYCC 5710]|uniref:Uncharacterized protein n=1 Tax=Taphrina deformans (strain PYCC 5710 / ATCC 11124 / CBS 356.35 / IMI 108563 / JCM 9778 / NBRC 8474) TaxID=1097556 RepID=R4XG75_TAPDE|nr:protein of unknown function [Taphrina deformans PYCC 5710]|eukprot:CCG84750.1 protein of unknown function [Taphrina deformans PYCC 5710]
MNRATLEAEESVEAERAGNGERLPWLEHLGFSVHLQGMARHKIVSSYGKPSPLEPGYKVMVALGEISTAILEETLGWCQDGRECCMTRPMAVTLTQFAQAHKEVDSKFRGFYTKLEPATVKRYFAQWQGLFYYYYCVTKGLALVNDSGEALCQATTEQGKYQALFEDNLEDENTFLQETFVNLLSLTFIRCTRESNQFGSILLSYCASLAVLGSGSSDQTGGMWREPGNLNSSYSALIYCAQLLIFRESLSLSSLTGSDRKSPDENVADLSAQWLNPKRRTSVGLMLHWRLYLFSVSKSEVSTQEATRSLDQTQITYRGTCISMEEITKLYNGTYKRARAILNRDLLLGMNHLPRMQASKLKDSSHIKSTGWWFGKHEENSDLLHGADRSVMDFILSKQE